jgi:hypothetical protein
MTKERGSGLCFSYDMIFLRAIYCREKRDRELPQSRFSYLTYAYDIDFIFFLFVKLLDEEGS